MFDFIIVTLALVAMGPVNIPVKALRVLCAECNSRGKIETAENLTDSRGKVCKKIQKLLIYHWVKFNHIQHLLYPNCTTPGHDNPQDVECNPEVFE